ncbi:MAG TPA: hypothetical protein DEQ02_09910 [Ruminococcaceae bacterium]|nr:hypothetical protein [Oscillospiraceae bacterium]
MSHNEFPDNFENIEFLCQTVRLTTDIRCQPCLGAPEALECYSDSHCEICPMLSEYFPGHQNCRREVSYAAFHAKKTGEPYLYTCRLGLYHFAVPLGKTNEKNAEFLLAGPILIGDERDYLLESLVNRFSLSHEKKRDLETVLNTFAVVSAEKLRALTDLFAYFPVSFAQNSLPLEAYYTDSNITVSAHALIDKEDALFFNVLKGNEQYANEILKDLIDNFRSFSSSDFSAIKARAIELALILSRMAARIGVNYSLFGSTSKYMKEIASLATIEEISDWLDTAFKKFSAQVIENPKKDRGDLLPAIQYIKEKFSDKITLEETAEKVFLTPAYFSRVFKDHMGVSFSNYLNRLRVENAKKCINEDLLSLSEIAAASGFGSQSYFSKVFRIYSGMTPKEYKNHRYTQTT